MVKLSDINFVNGSVNPSGLTDTVYFIERKNISAWPTIEDDPEVATDLEDLVVMTGDFTLVAGETWKRLYVTQGKCKATAEATGETDCKMFLNKAELSYPKMTDSARALQKMSVNGDFVYIVKHAGNYHVIGSKDYRTTTSPSSDTGDSAGSAHGQTFSLECPDVTPLPRYTGVLQMSDGSLDCSTDVFTPSE